MKQGKSVITFAMAAIAVALVIYFGFYVAKVFSEPYTTALAYTYTSNDSSEAVGILVRQETVLPAQTGIVDVTRSEGEKVGVGQSVAQVYRDSQAQTNQADLEALADQIQLLEYSSDGGGVDSAAKLDEEILQAVVELRASAALDDYSQLEDQEVSGANITAAMARIEGMMDKVVEGFEKQLDQLFQGDAMDITTDVEVLERMLAKDGLSDHQGMTLEL